MTSDRVAVTGTPTKPDLKPRRGWFIAAMIVFLAWVGALLILYFRAVRG